MVPTLVVVGILGRFFTELEGPDLDRFQEELRRERERHEAACAAGEFGKIELPAGLPREEVERLTRSVRIAVGTTHFPRCDCDVETVASPWPGVDVFRIVHGSCMTLTVRDIAVDRSGRTSLLTGFLPGDGRSTEEALQSFEVLGEIHGLWLDDAAQAEAYLRFVMAVFVEQSRGVSLPGREVADHIATLEWNSPESNSLKEKLWEEEPERPHVERIAKAEDSWTARAFTWQSWCGSIDLYELAVTTRGKVTFRTDDYASQGTGRGAPEDGPENE